MKKSVKDATTAPNETRPAAGLTVGELRLLIADVVHAVLDEREARPKAELVSQDELAAAIGVSDRTVRTLRTRGLPVVMVGDSPRFVIADVHAWLALQKRRGTGVWWSPGVGVWMRGDGARKRPATKAEIAKAGLADSDDE